MLNSHAYFPNSFHWGGLYAWDFCSQRKISLHFQQRKFFAKKRMQRKIFLEIHHFWDILLLKSQFFGHFPHEHYFFKHFINKLNVPEKSFFKNHIFHGICITTLIHYSKMENKIVIFFFRKIFFAFSLPLCKEFKFFFASSQRMKSAKI